MMPSRLAHSPELEETEMSPLCTRCATAAVVVVVVVAVASAVAVVTVAVGLAEGVVAAAQAAQLSRAQGLIGATQQE